MPPRIFYANQLFHEIKTGDLNTVQSLVADHPWLLDIGSPRYCATPLSDAALHGNIEIASVLLKAGADINASSGPSVGTPLQRAIIKKHLAMASLLLEKGADIHDQNGILSDAVSTGDLALVKLLIKHGAPIQGNDEPTIFSALYRAYEKRHSDIAEYLRKQGAQLNIFLAMMAGDANFIKAAVRENPKVLEQRLKGYNWYMADAPCPLHYAVLLWCEWLVELLLELGADPQAKTSSGLTPISVAFLAGLGYSQLPSAEMIHLLQSHGKPMALQDLVMVDDLPGLVAALEKDCSAEDKNVALVLACRVGCIDAVKRLLKAGADLNARLENKLEWSALYCAVLSQNVNLVRVLLEQRAYSDTKHQENITPLLSLAIAFRNCEMLSLLLDHGADPNRIDTEDAFGNALHQSLYVGTFETTQLLLAGGADPNIRGNDAEQVTPLHLAVCGHNIDWERTTLKVQLLLEAGARTDIKDAVWDATPYEWAKYYMGEPACPDTLLDRLAPA